MSCPSCERPTTPGARFCASCGAVLADATTDSPRLDATGSTPRDTGGGAADEDAGDDDAGELDPTPGATTTAVVHGVIVECPACAAPNADGRILCARCGADLATGQVPAPAAPVVRPGPVVDVAGDIDVTERRSGSRTAALVLAIVVVGALVGVLVGVWAVGSRGGAAAPPPSFDASVYTGEPEPLEVVGVGASSTRPPAGEEAFEAANMVDDDLSTAWSHNPAAEAATDVDVAFELAQPSWVTDVLVANGAQADPASFAAEGRVAGMLLVVGGESVAELRLLDQDGFQQVTLPEPVLVEMVRLVVTDVVAGDTDTEVSISEIAFRGYPARGEDVAG